MWRTTSRADNLHSQVSISIHVLRVEDDPSILLHRALLRISIHVLRVEDDAVEPGFIGKPGDFNPRPPCGGRPPQSLHRGRHTHFNPRPPCGGRPSVCVLICPRQAFQSTSSVWRTTIVTASDTGPQAISIHVLRVEDDLQPEKAADKQRNFNPRPPCGGRPVQLASVNR